MKLTLFLGNLGTGEIILLVVVVLLLFGGKKIPELMRGMGKGVRSFRQGMAEVEDENRQLMNNRHISEGYLTLRSSVCTKDGYDRAVSELLDRLREIRSENFKNTMKVIGKILLYILKAVGIIFVLIWTIIKVFLPHDDDN